MKQVGILSLALLLTGIVDGQNRINFNHREGFSLSGEFKDALNGDTITLIVWEYFVPKYNLKEISARTYRAPVRQGKFLFQVPRVDSTFYFTLKTSREGADPVEPLGLLYHYLGERGDQVHIAADSLHPQFYQAAGGKRTIVKFNPDTIVFSGNGASKYKCQYAIQHSNEKKLELASLERQNHIKRFGPPAAVKWDSAYFEGIPQRLYESIKVADSIKRKRMGFVDQYSKGLTKLAKEVLYANIIGGIDEDFVTLYNISSIIGGKKVSQKFADSMKTVMAKLFMAVRLPDISTVPATSLARSINYLPSITNRSQMSVINKGKSPSEYILTTYPSTIFRDYLLANYFLSVGHFVPNVDLSIKAIFPLIESSSAQAALINYLKRRAVGQKIYNFNLTTLTGKKLRLDDFTGKLVFMDFWYTGCAGCAQFYEQQLSKVENKFKESEDLVFLIVCVDQNEAEWRKSVAEGKYTHAEYSNVINAFTNGNGKKDPFIESLGVSSYPFPLLIDREGKILQSSNLRTSENELVTLLEKAIRSN